MTPRRSCPEASRTALPALFIEGPVREEPIASDGTRPLSSKRRAIPGILESPAVDRGRGDVPIEETRCDAVLAEGSDAKGRASGQGRRRSRAARNAPSVDVDPLLGPIPHRSDVAPASHLDGLLRGDEEGVLPGAPARSEEKPDSSARKSEEAHPAGTSGFGLRDEPGGSIRAPRTDPAFEGERPERILGRERLLHMDVRAGVDRQRPRGVLHGSSWNVSPSIESASRPRRRMVRSDTAPSSRRETRSSRPPSHSPGPHSRGSRAGGGGGAEGSRHESPPLGAPPRSPPGAPQPAPRLRGCPAPACFRNSRLACHPSLSRSPSRSLSRCFPLLLPWAPTPSLRGGEPVAVLLAELRGQLLRVPRRRPGALLVRGLRASTRFFSFPPSSDFTAFDRRRELLQSGRGAARSGPRGRPARPPSGPRRHPLSRLPSRRGSTAAMSLS